MFQAEKIVCVKYGGVGHGILGVIATKCRKLEPKVTEKQERCLKNIRGSLCHFQG